LPNARILIIEDEAIVAADLTSKLSQLGYCVIGTASQAERGIALAEEKKPDLVLMDVRLDGSMDGIEAAERIRAICDRPVIFLTAHSDPDTMARAKLTMPFAYILKPFTVRELETHIEIALYRHQIERVLMETLTLQRAILDSAGHFIVSVDLRGIIRTFNQAAESALGYRADEVIGKQTLAIFSDVEELERHADKLSQELHCSVTPGFEICIANVRLRLPEESEWTLIRKDGSRFPAQMSMTALRDPARRITGFLGIGINITERKQAEEQLQHFAAELEQRVVERTQALVQSQEGLRALATELNLVEQRERKRFAMDLHDHLAQWLVLGRIKLSQLTRTNLPARSKSLITEADEVLKQALDYARSLVTEMSPPVLHEFGLPVALKWLANNMGRHELTVTGQIELEDLPLAEDQAILLFQSVRELLMNVIKHAKVKVAAISISHDNDVLRVTVTDSGCGFNPAATASAETMQIPSAHFGLFSIRERMRALGGRLELDSNPGHGTTATLVLPLNGVSVASAELKILGAEPGSNNSALHQQDAKQIRVLLVDDHAMLRQGLRSVLEHYPDIDIVGEAADGEEAVAMARSLRPEIIVMDVSMPKLDGIKATRQLKQEQPRILVIGLSVDNSSQAEQAMTEAGATHFLTKDAAVERLYQTIQTALVEDKEETVKREA
jgi:PAS domain S-box-containing protein